ncbi:hypothetical protein [Bordetella sp. 15P40C-2]|uniref:hypothetical protein n=1 Tax=Bordetella sp. 15P40C-2 TaxID=2572246 RepID=UPI0013236A24|nr:hypothetical protein [Bordetella sp. 15P40C-2]MVW72127.1 hypothetical protein [Bordetella sp. 15P40C-2]
MTACLDDLLDQVYDRDSNNCLHYAAVVWERLTGDSRLRQVREDDFRAGQLAALFRGYKRVDGPTREPSIVLMENLSGESHIGVCWQGRLAHMPQSGPEFLPFDASRALYRKQRFYA